MIDFFESFRKRAADVARLAKMQKRVRSTIDEAIEDNMTDARYAAAQIMTPQWTHSEVNDKVKSAVNVTLERCAQVADEYTAWPAREIAARIREKKK